MPNTYVALRTETVATATNSVTFSLSGISGYTDLEIKAAILPSVSTNQPYIQFNADTGTGTTNYSTTSVRGDGSSAASGRHTNQYGWFPVPGPGIGTNGNPEPWLVSVMNYSNTTTFKTGLSRFNNASSIVSANAHLWRSTAAITSITITMESGNFNIGSTFSLYGIANADQGSAKATGGIITEDSQYWYHTFGASGAFIPKQSLTCDVLVVAGGGGGAELGGGGGAGGLLAYTSQSLTTTTYNVTVGAGGIGTWNGTGVAGGNGVNSQFGALGAATGGGGGGRYDATGNSGGSGGGAGRQWTTAATGIVGQGNNGGISNASWTGVAAGGGGSGAVGGNVQSSSRAGDGGIGVTTYNSWSIATGIGQNVSGTYYLAGGGGGGYLDVAESGKGIGGLGGGGNGGWNFSAGKPTNGLANTGGGAGGASGANGVGANGGSGVVIVRYAK